MSMRAPARPQDGLTQFLGWFSLGLGVPQTAAPGSVCETIGVRVDDRSRFWMRVVGIRELVAAGGILGQRRPTGFVWARVGGDAMDLTLLALALAFKRECADRLLGAIGSVVGIAVADVVDGVRLSRASDTDETGAMRVKAAVTVRRSPEDVYRFWHDFENLPRFMDHLESVDVSNGRSHWKVKAPAGRTVEWDAEVVEDRPNQRIAWRSLGSGVTNSGSVSFKPAPGDRGTEIRLDMRYAAPGGVVGATVAKLLGEAPDQQASDDLRRFKQIVETGIVVRSDGTPEGTNTRRLLHQRPAQPLPSR
jgi:uncharacterized membrane protein